MTLGQNQFPKKHLSSQSRVSSLSVGKTSLKFLMVEKETLLLVLLVFLPSKD